MDDTTSQVFSRLSLHEFILEVMFSNWLAGMSKQDADTFLNEFELRMKSAWTREGVDADDQAIFTMLNDSKTMGENFLSKVRDRSTQIRAKSSQR